MREYQVIGWNIFAIISKNQNFIHIFINLKKNFRKKNNIAKNQGGGTKKDEKNSFFWGICHLSLQIETTFFSKPLNHK